MKHIVRGGYKRVSKSEARRRYNNGETIRFTACNIVPDNLWGAYSDANNGDYTQVSSDGFNTTIARNKDFDTVVSAFTYYNCVDSETGRYPAYYVKEQ